MKSNVLSFTKNGVEFTDKSIEIIDKAKNFFFLLF